MEMNEQLQEMFLQFILERVQEGKEEEARELLLANFKKLNEGTFTQEDAIALIPKFLTLLKQDRVQEVQDIVMQFAGSVMPNNK